MQAEFVQWERSVKAECIFYVNIMRSYSKVEIRHGGSIPFFDFVSLHPCVLCCYVLSAALLNLTTGLSSWSSRIAVPLPLLVCLYLKIF